MQAVARSDQPKTEALRRSADLSGRAVNTAVRVAGVGETMLS